jgi:hypothetical protein
VCLIVAESRKIQPRHCDKRKRAQNQNNYDEFDKTIRCSSSSHKVCPYN